MQRSLSRDCANARSLLGDIIKNKYESLKEFGEFAESNPDELSYKTDDGVTRRIIAKHLHSLSHHVLFYDAELLGHFTDDEMFVDGTFDARPQIKHVNQLLTVLVTKFNTVNLTWLFQSWMTWKCAITFSWTVPIAWVLMSRRTIKAYKTVWQEIRGLFPNFNPKCATTDFEKGLRRSIWESFPGIKLVVCHFHFCQVNSVTNELFWKSNFFGYKIPRKF